MNALVSDRPGRRSRCGWPRRWTLQAQVDAQQRPGAARSDSSGTRVSNVRCDISAVPDEPGLVRIPQASVQQARAQAPSAARPRHNIVGLLSKARGKGAMAAGTSAASRSTTPAPAPSWAPVTGAYPGTAASKKRSSPPATRY